MWLWSWCSTRKGTDTSFLLNITSHEIFENFQHIFTALALHFSPIPLTSMLPFSIFCLLFFIVQKVPFGLSVDLCMSVYPRELVQPRTTAFRKSDHRCPGSHLLSRAVSEGWELVTPFLLQAGMWTVLLLCRQPQEPWAHEESSPVLSTLWILRSFCLFFHDGTWV